ncbi:MAG: 1-acyl-sn-glycerol-3-phosphate acyltransferase [Parachlamydiaceae bacterium]
MSDLLLQLNRYLENGRIDAKLFHVMESFYESYLIALAHLPSREKCQEMFKILMELVVEQVRHPYQFSVFHRSLRVPFDYYQFGLDFIRPFVDFNRSQIFGLDQLELIRGQLKRGDNVILLSNHQTEPDPQIISLLLEKSDPELAREMIFVAGHRVTTDPLAIPMSLGRNLLCIYSKKHVSYSPDKKEEKILHNQRTLKQMQELLNQGGYCIYVAPSGGRDRRDLVTGDVQVAPFDPQSIELFWLLGRQAKHPVHFYPLALRTYDLMPPPKLVEKDLGERRLINFTPVYLAFCDEVQMKNFAGSEGLDKKSKQNKRAEYIWKQVCKKYDAFP